MKTWQWAALGVGAIIVIVLIERMSKPTAYPSTSLASASGLGSFLGGILNKVSAPSANPAGMATPGSSGTPPSLSIFGGSSSTPVDTGFTASQGAQYSAAMASTGEAASLNAGSGGTTFNGGLATSAGDPLGIGVLSNPGFDTGTMGADFSS